MIRNARAEAQICERLPMLRRYVISRLKGSVAQAEDIAGQTALKMIEFIRKGHFKEGHSIDAFMIKCAQTEIFNYYKGEHQKKRTKTDEYEYHFRISVKSPEREYEIRTENEAFMRKTEKLKVIYRKIVILLLFQNMKHREIAETLGILRTTTSTNILRIRKQLKGTHLSKAREYARLKE